MSSADFGQMADDLAERGGLCWSHIEPDDGECSDCGATTTPIQHPFEQRWIPAPKLCGECQQQRDRQRADHASRQDDFETAWGRVQIKDGKRREVEQATLPDDQVTARLTRLTRRRPDPSLECWGIHLRGGVGVGKSIRALCAIREFLRYWIVDEGERVAARYCNLARAIVRKQRSFDTDQVVDFGEFEDADFLVVDDLGREKATEWSASLVYSLIEARIENRAPTVFVSNAPLSELAKEHENYDDRLTDRILEICGGRIGNLQTLEVTGPNWRKGEHNGGDS